MPVVVAVSVAHNSAGILFFLKCSVEVSLNVPDCHCVWKPVTFKLVFGFGNSEKLHRAESGEEGEQSCFIFFLGGWGVGGGCQKLLDSRHFVRRQRCRGVIRCFAIAALCAVVTQKVETLTRYTV